MSHLTDYHAWCEEICAGLGYDPRDVRSIRLLPTFVVVEEFRRDELGQKVLNARRDSFQRRFVVIDPLAERQCDPNPMPTFRLFRRRR